MRKIFVYHSPVLTQQIDNLSFVNPVGLAAGFDKEGEIANFTNDIGFGFTTVGSVTSTPYIGNMPPRLYRLPKSKGIVVYFGLKSSGVEKISKRLASYGKLPYPLIISVAKTNAAFTADDDTAVEDYANCMLALYQVGVGDIYEINISCPNTFGGEPFTTPEKLRLLLAKLTSLNVNKPLWVKMPIDLPFEAFAPLVSVCVEFRIQAVVIGNLTKDRSLTTIKDVLPAHVQGGISGKPTFEKSNNLIRETYANFGDKIKIVGLGGIFSAEDAYLKIKLGASLVELITGMIYMGPQVIGQINEGLAELLKKDGFKNISGAVGSANK